MSQEQVQFYADLVAAKGGVQDDAIRRAFAETDRSVFLGDGPWKIFTPIGYIETPNDDPCFIYHDVAVGLAAERSINNGEPSLHARCLGAIGVRPGEHVLHVGAGTGYYTAVLARLVGASGQVSAYEIETDLAEKAVENLAALPWTTVSASSAIGPALPACDVIYVNAGATRPASEWLDALRPGGRLIFPLTTAQGTGVMVLVTYRNDRLYDARIVAGVAFIPCVGARNEQESKSLSLALTRAGQLAAVRSLKRDAHPDESCWLHGTDWWFSTHVN